MSLMEKVRASGDNVVMQLIFGAIVLSFVFWGVGSKGPTSTVIAEVNGVRITDTAFQKQMRRAMRGRRGTLSDDEVEYLKTQVVNQMVRDEVLLQAAEDLGVEVSDAEVARFIRQYDAFRDEEGKFSFSMYERALQASGFTTAQFQQSVREDLTRQRLAELAAYSVQVMPSEVERAYIAQNSTLSLRWVRTSSGSFRDDVVISDEDLAAAIEEKAEKIQSLYEAQRDRRFTRPRSATLRTILLRTDLGDLADEAVSDRMDDVVRALEASENLEADFAAMAARWSEHPSAVDGGSIGTQSEPDLAPEIAEAIFSAEVGGLSPVVKTEDGYQVFLVESVTEAEVTSLEDATEEIARELLIDERAPALAESFAQEVLSAWQASGEPPTELLEAQNLQVGEAEDLSLDATTIPRLGPAEDILAAARAASSGEVLGELYDVAGAKVVVQVVERSEADMEQFEEERISLRQQLLMRERAAFVQEWIDSLVLRAKTTIYLS